MPRAQRRAREISAWWQAHRDAPTLFDQELAGALALLAREPYAGRASPTHRERAIYRLLLPRSAQHVYYAVVEEEVRIMSIWGARRQRPPKL